MRHDRLSHRMCDGHRTEIYVLGHHCVHSDGSIHRCNHHSLYQSDTRARKARHHRFGNGCHMHRIFRTISRPTEQSLFPAIFPRANLAYVALVSFAFTYQSTKFFLIHLLSLSMNINHHSSNPVQIRSQQRADGLSVIRNGWNLLYFNSVKCICSDMLRGLFKVTDTTG